MAEFKEIMGRVKESLREGVVYDGNEGNAVVDVGSGGSTMDAIREHLRETTSEDMDRRLQETVGRPVRKSRLSRQEKENLLLAYDLIESASDGNEYSQYLIKEAMTTADFQHLFGQIIDRTLLEAYKEQAYSWYLYCKRRLVRDFRKIADYTIDGADGTLPQKDERDGYQQSLMIDGEFNFQVNEYGRTIALSFRTLVNDDLDAFRDIPMRFGKAARRTEEKFATALFCDTSGPIATFFSTTPQTNQYGTKTVTQLYGNQITDNPVLSVTSLATAIEIMMSRFDKTGEPIAVEAMTLVVPPLLYPTARNILQATQLWLNENGGTSNSRLIGANWANEIVKLATNYYVPVIATSANANTSWWLFADPEGQRPSIVMGNLRGYESPQVFMKANNAVALTGGGVVVGDFNTDDQLYKVRHIIGGAMYDPIMCVASNGSGS